jgi:hypothetical protein
MDAGGRSSFRVAENPHARGVSILRGDCPTRHNHGSNGVVCPPDNRWSISSEPYRATVGGGFEFIGETGIGLTAAAHSLDPVTSIRNDVEPVCLVSPPASTWRGQDSLWMRSRHSGAGHRGVDLAPAFRLVGRVIGNSRCDARRSPDVCQVRVPLRLRCMTASSRIKGYPR